MFGLVNKCTCSLQSLNGKKLNFWFPSFSIWQIDEKGNDKWIDHENDFITFFFLQSDHQGTDGSAQSGSISALQHSSSADPGSDDPTSPYPFLAHHSRIRIAGHRRSSDSSPCKSLNQFGICLKTNPPGVNFINILRTNFLYKRCFGSFFYVHVIREKAAKTMFVQKIHM